MVLLEEMAIPEEEVVVAGVEEEGGVVEEVDLSEEVAVVEEVADTARRQEAGSGSLLVLMPFPWDRPWAEATTSSCCMYTFLRQEHLCANRVWRNYRYKLYTILLSCLSTLSEL
jgi:hypothetical protein